MSTLETFEPRKTPRFFIVLSDFFIAVLLLFWGSGAWFLSQLMRHRAIPAAVLFLAWLILASLAFLALHRSGRVRLWISFTTTALVLFATAAVISGWT
jgi:hypothetical protein